MPLGNNAPDFNSLGGNLIQDIPVQLARLVDSLGNQHRHYRKVAVVAHEKRVVDRFRTGYKRLASKSEALLEIAVWTVVREGDSHE